MSKSNIYLLFICAVFLISCGSADEKKQKNFNPDQYKKPLENANKELVKNEEKQIQDYINRYKWDMVKTQTGLRYVIYKEGKGKKAEKGLLATINYSIELINGIKAYSSDEQGPKEFLIGKDDEINGLHEGILFMGIGDHAKFIIPSYLAYGLIGDKDRIPKRATLIYDVELIDLKEP